MAVDFWSLQLLMNELLMAYGRRQTNVLGQPPRATYLEYAQAQAHRMAGSEGKRLQAYWDEKLRSLPVLELPLDRPRPPLQTYAGAVYGFSLGSALSRRLQTLAASSETTLFTILMTAFQALLHHYSHAPDLPVGTMAAGRDQTRYKDVVGLFTNQLVIRGDASGNPSVSDFLARMKHTVLEALMHQAYPFQLLVERHQPKRDRSRSPLFQVMFLLQKAHHLLGTAPFSVQAPDEHLVMGGLHLKTQAFKQTIVSIRPELHHGRNKRRVVCGFRIQHRSF